MILTKIKLRVNDLSLTRAFYTEQLNVELIHESSNELTFRVGQTELIFSEAKSDDEFVYHLAFNIPSNKLAEAIQWAKGRLEIIRNFNNELVTALDAWKSESVYFYDTNGNLLEFIAREAIDESNEEGFDSSQIVNVSEIGFVVDQPLKVAAEWMQKLPITFFDKAKPTNDFLALGDDEGLLIFVSKQRNWFPTTIPAKSFPITFSLDIQGELFENLSID